MANLSNINNKLIVTDGGNLLVNKTAANNAAVGVQLMSTGDVNGTVSGDTVARFNRLGTDGEIIRFQQDSGTDGAINSLSGRIAIGSGNTGIFFDSIRQVVTPHNMTTNGNEFNNISFGRSLIRFKDIYLSGKIAAGTGTTAAATINAFTTTVSTGLHSALRILENTGASSYWDIGATNGASTILNFYHNGTTTPKITFTHTGGATFAGDVGIGTTSPSAKLDIGGNTAGSVQATFGRGNNDNNFAVRYINGDAGTNNTIQGAIGLDYANGTWKDMASVKFIRDSTAGELAFYTSSSASNGSERMRIDSSGNASIGDGGAGARGARLFLNNTGSQGTPQLMLVDSNDSGKQSEIRFDSGNLIFDYWGGTSRSERMRIRSSGTVGIGSDGFDSQMLTIAAGTLDGAIYATSTDANCFASFRDSSSTANIEYGAIGNAHVFRKDASEYMRIDGNGNVGIGTTSPSEILHLNKTSGTGCFIRFQNTGGSGVYIGGRSEVMEMYTNGSEKMRITSGGDVGIGATSPSQKLEVNGAVLAGDYRGSAQIYLTSPDSWIFRSTSGSERMRITSAGNVVINYTATGGVIDPVNSKFTVGTQPPYNLANSQINPTTATFFSDKMTNNGYNSILQLVSVRTSLTSGQFSNGYLGFSTVDNSNAQGVIDAGRIAIVNENGGARNSATALSFWTNTPNGNVSNTPATEKMRITSAGNVLISKTSAGSVLTKGVELRDEGNIFACTNVANTSSYFSNIATSGTRELIRFYAGTAQVGSINSNGTTTAYNTTSDYRLKEDLQDFAGLDMVSKIPVYDYKWKTDESRSYGVMAHELQKVLPQAVSGEKDAEEMQSVDYSKIVPLLVKSIQELKAEIELLKSK